MGVRKFRDGPRMIEDRFKDRKRIAPDRVASVHFAFEQSELRSVVSKVLSSCPRTAARALLLTKAYGLTAREAAEREHVCQREIDRRVALGKRIVVERFGPDFIW